MFENKITSEEKCTGCGLCSYSCKLNCIEMIDDEEGFQVPFIDELQCKECGLCKSICPMNNNSNNFNSVRKTIAAQLYDQSNLEKSASGGAFAGIARAFIRAGGIVVGCTDDINCGGFFRTIRAEHEIDLLVGSKYYQCDLSKEIYETVNAELNNQKKVLFIGTPCQVDGVKRSVKKSENLLLVEILCQGVPSKKVVKYYHSDMEKKYGKEIKEHLYRSKERQDRGQYVTKLIFNDNSKYYGKGEGDLYNRSFQRKIFLRESCYNCKYACKDRVSDITLGDFWGLKEFKFSIKDGVSLVLINSKKAENIYNTTTDILFSSERLLEEAIPYNQPLNKSAKRSVLRTVSYKLLDRFGFSFTTRLLCYRYYVKRALRR